MTFEYKIDDVPYRVEVIKKSNKNTYIKIKDDLTIYVTTNYLMRKSDIKCLLYKEEGYLKKALKRIKERIEKQNDFYYLGKKYDIILTTFKKIEIQDNKIYANSKNALENWLKKQMLILAKERLDVCFQKFEEKIPYPDLKIRTMKTRWGVCNRKNLSITLNTKLIRYETEVMDYVIIHELSHLVHFDHSKRFWQTVLKYMPNYKECVKILKE